MPDPTSQSPGDPSPLSATALAPAGAAPEVLAGRENQRIKQLVKASLFASAQPPVKIGRYTVVRPIGAGGMGMVYAAYDDELNRKIAVKLLRSGSSEHDRARLFREAQAMAKLSHPNVLTVHEVGTFEDQVYVAMEFVRGQNLRDWLREAPRPWRTIIDRFVLAGRGLAAAHAVGLVHRDFKPANVLVGDDGQIMVSDFGLVRSAGDGSNELSQRPQMSPLQMPLSTSLTMTGMIMGTPAYMSPEQHLGQASDARSDQFSFCVALYEALYGVLPFAGETLLELAQTVTTGQLRDPPRDSKVPVWVWRLLLRGLATTPAERWPTIDELLDELSRDPERAARLRRNAALIIALVMTVITGLIWLVRERGEAASTSAQAEARAQQKKDDAERERDRAFADLEEQLKETERALAEAKKQREVAEAQTRRAEKQTQLAEQQTRLAEERRGEAETQRRLVEGQRKEADRQRREAEHQTGRAVAEARRARDATRLARSLGAAAEDPTTVLALLRETEAPSETPGWVPAAVETLLQPVSQAILRVHQGTVHGAAFSPDGTTIATAADDGEVLLWHWKSGTLKHLGRHQGSVSSVEISADGDRILTASADGKAVLWSVDGEALSLQHPHPVTIARLSPDGRSIATAAQDDAIRIWSIEQGTSRVLGRHRGPVHALIFSPSGDHLASASADGTARLWSLHARGRETVLSRQPSAVRALAFDAKGERLASAAQDGMIRIFHLGKEGDPRLLRGHKSEVIAVTFTADGRQLVSASLDGTARLWTLSNDTATAVVLRGHRGRIYTAKLSPDDRRIVTASQDGSARVWDRLRPNSPPLVLKGHTEELASATFSPDGSRVVTTSRDNSVRIWSLDSVDRTTLHHDTEVRCASFSPRGDRLLTCAGKREVWRWQSGAATPERRLRHRSQVIDARFAADDTIVTVTRDGAIRRWPREGPPVLLLAADAHGLRRAVYHPATRRLLSAAMVEQARLRTIGKNLTNSALRGHSGTLHALAFSPDGHLMATGSSDRSARIWGDEGRVTAILRPHSGRVTSIAFRPDGLEIATASWDKRIRVWGLDGKLRATLVGHEGPVWSIAYSPDGRSLVSASADRSVRIWPADGRGQAILLRGHHGPVLSATYRADGLAIISASEDGSARIWDTDVSPASLQERLWQASPVCLPPRQRIQLLAEDESTANAAYQACTDEATRHR